MTEENAMQQEETKEEEKVEESSPKDSKEKLSEMVDRLEKANNEAKEILQRQEELAAKNLLGGKSEAGNESEKPKEETPADYAKRVEEEFKEGKLT